MANRVISLPRHGTSWARARLRRRTMPHPLTLLGQTLLPKKALTALAGRLAAAPNGVWSQALIRWFIKRYQVNMTEAANGDPGSYRSFNDFFTRALRDGARPLAQSDLICPVDGRVSQFGRIEQGRIFQAKGHHYNLAALLGGTPEPMDVFAHGCFATLYLSPSDYHRIHMPCAGRLMAMSYVPGELFSVNPASVSAVPGLFARNERLVCFFASAQGDFVMVLVGATIVGSIATVWHGIVNATHPAAVKHWDYRAQQIHLQQGQEMGRFLLGSTVLLLLANDGLRFNPDWQPGCTIRMGQAMAHNRPPDLT